MPDIQASDVILSVMTLRNAPLAERIRAAAAAGFKAIGIRLSDYQQALESGLSVNDIDALLDKHNVQVVEIEFLREWIGREQDIGYQKNETELFAIAKYFGARHINVGVFTEAPLQQAMTSYAALCERAAAYNLIVQLEFMPYTPPVDSLEKAWAVVQAAGQANAGLLIDAWHYARTPGSSDFLKYIPPKYITCVQLGDVRAEPLADIVEESRHYRHVPSEGALDLPAFMLELHAHGIRAPLSVEVMSDALDALSTSVAAHRVATGIRSTLGIGTNRALAA